MSESAEWAPARPAMAAKGERALLGLFLALFVASAIIPLARPLRASEAALVPILAFPLCLLLLAMPRGGPRRDGILAILLAGLFCFFCSAARNCLVGRSIQVSGESLLLAPALATIGLLTIWRAPAPRLLLLQLVVAAFWIAVSLPGVLVDHSLRTFPALAFGYSVAFLQGVDLFGALLGRRIPRGVLFVCGLFWLIAYGVVRLL